MIFDIGANVGRWTLANIHFDDTIVCVEPDSTTFGTLLHNVQHNPKVQCINYAVCKNVKSDNNDITFYKCHYDVLSTLNKEWLTSPDSRFYNTPYETITCKTITIDAMIAQFGVPSMIKIDVEGGEYECISSLTQKVDVLCFEWASELNDVTYKCMDHLSTLGFTKFCVQYEDHYAYRPPESLYTTLSIVKEELSRTTPKEHWGMVWCA